MSQGPECAEAGRRSGYLQQILPEAACALLLWLLQPSETWVLFEQERQVRLSTPRTREWEQGEERDAKTGLVGRNVQEYDDQLKQGGDDHVTQLDLCLPLHPICHQLPCDDEPINPCFLPLVD